MPPLAHGTLQAGLGAVHGNWDQPIVEDVAADTSRDARASDALPSFTRVLVARLWVLFPGEIGLVGSDAL